MPRTPKAPKPSRAITPQKVRTVLRNYFSSASDQESGFEIHRTKDKKFIRVEWTCCNVVGPYSWYNHNIFVGRYAAALAAAGIAAEIRDGAVWVAVDQEKPSKSGD